MARITDAINAALSKHNLLILLASFRIGREHPTSSASAIVYVVCDHPMCLKSSRSSTLATESKAATQKMKDVRASAEDCRDSQRGEGINSLAETCDA